MFESNPGISALSPKEKQGYVEDFGKLSQAQLLEILERQNALLRNMAFVKRLPDKGEKITAFKSRIEAEMDRRKEVEKTTALLEKLNMNCPIEEIEWTGRYSDVRADADEESTKGDDETNVIKILASHGRTSKTERVLKPPEESVTQNDAEKTSVLRDPYAKALCTKIAERSSCNVKENFKPFRTLKNRGESSPKQRTSSRSSLNADEKPQGDDGGESEGGDLLSENGHMDVREGAPNVQAVRRVRHWEVTAATPPPPVHEQTQMLQLEEAIALEKMAIRKVTEARAMQSMMRLTEQLQQQGSFAEYREAREGSSDEEDDDEKRRKEEEEEEGGQLGDEEPERDVAIVYSVVDCNDDEAG